jgi:hypothetical protein
VPDRPRWRPGCRGSQSRAGRRWGTCGRYCRVGAHTEAYPVCRPRPSTAPQWSGVACPHPHAQGRWTAPGAWYSSPAQRLSGRLGIKVQPLRSLHPGRPYQRSRHKRASRRHRCNEGRARAGPPLVRVSVSNRQAQPLPAGGAHRVRLDAPEDGELAAQQEDLQLLGAIRPQAQGGEVDEPGERRGEHKAEHLPSVHYRIRAQHSRPPGTATRRSLRRTWFVP